MLISIILGFITAFIVYKIIISHNTIYKGPDSSVVKEKIYHDDIGYYKLVPRPVVGRQIYK